MTHESIPQPACPSTQSTRHNNPHPAAAVVPGQETSPIQRELREYSALISRLENSLTNLRVKASGILGDEYPTAPEQRDDEADVGASDMARELASCNAELADLCSAVDRTTRRMEC